MKIAVVCLGNICRSPMAEVVLRDRLDGAGLDDVELVSAGTGGWHAGEKMDRRAAATLLEAGYDPERHRARQWPVGDPETYDLVLAMDADNLADLTDLAGQAPESRLRMFRDFDPEGSGDVPDPYYGGAEGFREVLAMVERTSDAIVASLATSRRGS
jgi:protein-tyrosine phosphatase